MLAATVLLSLRSLVEEPTREACGVEGVSAFAVEVCGLTDSTLWTAAAEWLVGKPLKILFILVLALLASRLAKRGINRLVAQMQDPAMRARLGRIKDRAKLDALNTGQAPSLRQAQRAEAVGAVFRSASTVVIWGIAIVTILAEVGIPIGPMIASAGIVGVALGFGAQSTVKDFLSGIFMLIEDQYGVGDIVDVEHATGVVESISLRSTRIRDVQGTLWHVPNGEIVRVGNMSQEWARALLDISVAYDTDIEHAQAIIMEVANAMWEEEDYREAFLEAPEMWGVQMLGADGIDLRLVIKTRPGEQYGIGRALRRRIKDRFDAEGIEIPFPQRTIWHRNADDDEGAAAPSKPAPKKRTRKSNG